MRHFHVYNRWFQKKAMPSAPHTSVFALNSHRHTIFIVKFKNLIHGTQKQGHPQECVCLYFIHHLPGWFQLLIVSRLWICPTTHRDTAENAREALTLHFSFSPLYLTLGPKNVLFYHFDCIILHLFLDSKLEKKNKTIGKRHFNMIKVYWSGPKTKPHDGTNANASWGSCIY